MKVLAMASSHASALSPIARAAVRAAPPSPYAERTRLTPVGHPSTSGGGRPTTHCEPVRLWNNPAMCQGGQNDVQSQEIEVLLHEYDSLRDEVLSRISARFQLLGYLSIAATLLGVSSISNGWHWVPVVVITVAVLIALWLYLGFAVRRCAVRLREIEEEVNDILHRKVLRWESGLRRGGLYGLFR